MLSRNWRCLYRSYSQTVTFRTSEISPNKHNGQQLGLFYTLEKDLCKQLFAHGGLPKSFTKQAKTFAETTIMIRKPALEIMNCIKSSDLTKPSVRYVLYGEDGSGKSISVAHLIHFAHENDFLIVHVPWVPEWLRRLPRHKEVSNSTTKEGFVDIPLDAVAWLIHFKNQNQSLFKKQNLTVSKEYNWSKREMTPAGAPLVELIDQGINRVKYSSDVIEALVQEIKTLSNTKQCKTFVAIDGFNGFFHHNTKLKTQTKKTVKPSKVTITQPFLELTKNDWSNGVIVVTVDRLVSPYDFPEGHHYPIYLLTKEGFEHLDPFVPIEVPRYTKKEFLSCTSYYRDRLWLRGPPETETELKFISALNPYKLMVLCAPL